MSKRLFQNPNTVLTARLDRFKTLNGLSHFTDLFHQHTKLSLRIGNLGCACKQMLTGLKQSFLTITLLINA